MAAQGEAHPSRAAQRLAWGHGVAQRWAECEVPLHAWVMRFWKKQKKCTEPLVLVTTDLRLNASWIVRHDEERPASEQDYAQRRRGGWQRQKRRATRESAMVLYGLTVVLSSRLYPLCTNTQAGTRLAAKTRQAIAFEPLRTQRTPIIVYAGGSCAIFATLRFVEMVWQWSSPVQERLRTWLSEHLNQMQKRE
jgi:hypothetical protein